MMINYKQSLVLCVILLGFCLLQTVHADPRSATATFQITATLVDPVEMKTDGVDSHMSPITPVQKTIAASLSTINAPATNIHVSVAKSDAIAACTTGACKGGKVELENLVLKTLTHGATQNVELNATDKLALNDKPGQYDGDMTVLLAVV